MPRTCFVIMPFSTTESCSEDEWTLLFEALFKPAIEGAGLDYECRRSVATRGNIVASILQELKESYVVLADLTDHNANVFYELGVRHSLKLNQLPILKGSHRRWENLAHFRESWSERVRLANSIELGIRHPWGDSLRFPDLIDAEPPN